MRQKDNNLLKMTEETIFQLESNRSIWQCYSVISDQLSKVKLIYELILENLSNKVKKSLNSYSKQKDLVISTLINKVYKIALKLKGYAKFNQKTDLLMVVDIEENELFDEPDSQIVVICEEILNQASGIQEHLIEEFNLTEDLIISASANLMQVKQMISIKDNLNKTDSLVNLHMKESIIELKTAIEVLDDLVYGIIEDKEFISSYRNTKKRNNVYYL